MMSPFVTIATSTAVLHICIILISTFPYIAFSHPTPTCEEKKEFMKALLIPGLMPWFHDHPEKRSGYLWMYKEYERYQRDILDGFPYLFVNRRNSSQSAYICLIEKSGSTSFKGLLIKHLNPTYFNNQLKTDKKGVHAGFKDLLISKKVPYMSGMTPTSSIPRIVIVRDPYSRVLSGFLDKVMDSSTSELENFGDKYLSMYQLPAFLNSSLLQKMDPPDAYAAFLKVLEKSKGKMNSHWSPQYEHCFMNKGLSFDYYLKVEHEHLWVGPLIEYLGLKEEASSGWNFSASWHHGHGENCFHSTNDEHCHGTHQNGEDNEEEEEQQQQRQHQQEQQEQQQKTPIFSGVSTRGGKRHLLSPKKDHDKHSAEKLSEYYTKENANLVTSVQLKDLFEFGYSVWDGASAEDYMKGLQFGALQEGGKPSKNDYLNIEC